MILKSCCKVWKDWRTMLYGLMFYKRHDLWFERSEWSSSLSADKPKQKKSEYHNQQNSTAVSPQHLKILIADKDIPTGLHKGPRSYSIITIVVVGKPLVFENTKNWKKKIGKMKNAVWKDGNTTSCRLREFFQMIWLIFSLSCMPFQFRKLITFKLKIGVVQVTTIKDVFMVLWKQKNQHYE